MSVPLPLDSEANGHHRLVAVTVFVYVAAVLTSSWAALKRSGLPATIGTVRVAASAPHVSATRTRVPAGAAINAGITASAAHCFVARAAPSISPAISHLL